MDGPQSIDDYKHLISDIVKKQVALLGPGLALSRARNVQGVKIEDDGTVSEMHGDPKELLQKVLDEYFVFSGLIVRRVMESILQSYPGIANSVQEQTSMQQAEMPIKN